MRARPLTPFIFSLSLVLTAPAWGTNSGFITDYAFYDGVHATVDGIYNPAEYVLTPITMSAASGGGGVLHSPGALYANVQSYAVDALTLGFQPGANLSDTVVLLLNYKTGGRTRGSGGGVVAINDTTDAARRALSTLQGTYPTGTGASTSDGFRADAAITINADGFGFFLFPDDQHATFTQVGTYTGVTDAGTGFREAAFPLTNFGPYLLGFEFAVVYAGDNFLYNEATPTQPYSGGINPGNQASGPVNFDNFYQLGTFIPAPGAVVMWGVGSVMLMRRRRV